MTHEIEPMAPQEAVDLCRADEQREYADSTIRSHGAELKFFAEWCGNNGIDAEEQYVRVGGTSGIVWGPVVATVIPLASGVYLLGAGLGVPVWVGLLGALVVGLVARGLWALAQRLRYRAQARPDPDPGADRVVVHAYRLETPAGDQWWARVNGDAVAHPDRDAAVDAVITAAQDWLADGQQHPSLASAHAERLREDGVAEIEETKTRVRSAVRREAEGRVRQEGMLNREDLEAELAERYPESIWRRELARLRSRGPLVERDGCVFTD